MAVQPHLALELSFVIIWTGGADTRLFRLAGFEPSECLLGKSEY